MSLCLRPNIRVKVRETRSVSRFRMGPVTHVFYRTTVSASCVPSRRHYFCDDLVLGVGTHGLGDFCRVDDGRPLDCGVTYSSSA